jgi:pyridinium-3,5-bisthiocarboxylic acid mononucleotide nickel chelatase
MMKVLYYDCFCGISGDMNLGALLDLGVDEDYLRRELSKLDLDIEYELQVKKDNKKGISGTRVDVVLKNAAHVHKHDHHHHHHHHEAQTGMASDNGYTHHAHRNLKDIENIIINSSLSDRVKKLSLAIFMKVAEAEAKVHGKPLYEVHFHEVGAVDSIIDIVGAAVCLDYLKVDKIMASAVQVGGGFVKCAHGIIPIPAPATIEILKNVPVKSGIVPFETTTPTGAAILAANVGTFTDHMDFSVEKIGYGIGHRELEIPNVLRIYLGYEDRSDKREEYTKEVFIMMEANGYDK